MIFRPGSVLTTGIGSLPHTDAAEAVELVLGSFDIPFWPQLPRLSFREQMIPQFSEGLPFVRLSEEKMTAWVERGNTDELERFYETYDEGTRIAISEGFAEGLHTFLALSKGRRFEQVKGQVTGPLTFTLGLNGAGGKPVFYDEELREVYLMGLKAKARWQADVLRPLAEGVTIFVDEPVVSALGSTAYMAVPRQEALRLLKDMVADIRRNGSRAGIHCCGRADWPMLIEAGVDILNFDAFEFGETLAIYPDEIRAFLEKGGVLAWGIVPTTEAIDEVSEDSLYGLFMERVEHLARFVPEELIARNLIITPSCGTGSRSKEETLRIFQLVMRMKEALL